MNVAEPLKAHTADILYYFSKSEYVQLCSCSTHPVHWPYGASKEVGLTTSHGSTRTSFERSTGHVTRFSAQAVAGELVVQAPVGQSSLGALSLVCLSRDAVRCMRTLYDSDIAIRSLTSYGALRLHVAHQTRGERCHGSVKPGRERPGSLGGFCRSASARSAPRFSPVG